MKQRYFLYLVTLTIFLLLAFSGAWSWRFLLSNVERTHEIKIDFLELQEVDIERYDVLVKKGS